MLNIIVQSPDTLTNLSIRITIQTALFNDMADLAIESSKELEKEEPNMSLVNRNRDKRNQIKMIIDNLITKEEN